MEYRIGYPISAQFDINTKVYQISVEAKISILVHLYLQARSYIYKFPLCIYIFKVEKYVCKSWPTVHGVTLITSHMENFYLASILQLFDTR